MKRIRVISVNNDSETKAKQSMGPECDINKIMEKYRNGGEIQHVNKAQARYGDFSSGLDFTRAYTAIAGAESAFAELPAYIRDKFGNDPEAFLYKMEEPAFRKDLEDCGVLDPEAGPITEERKSVAILDTEPQVVDSPTPRATPPGTPIMDQPSGTT